MAARLARNELDQAMQSLPGWRYDAQSEVIGKDFSFRDFSEAFGFMTRVALAAQAADHHPDWSNSYNKVSISLSTHSAGGVTQKDIELAAKIDALVPKA